MSDNLVTVATFARDWQAQLARNELEAAGIHSVIIDENVYRAIPPSGDSNGVKLQVRESDFEGAKRAIEAGEVTKEAWLTLIGQ